MECIIAENFKKARIKINQSEKLLRWSVFHSNEPCKPLRVHHPRESSNIRRYMLLDFQPKGLILHQMVEVRLYFVDQDS
jgi:hypothetical protein